MCAGSKSVRSTKKETGTKSVSADIKGAYRASGILPAWRYKFRKERLCKKRRVRTQAANANGNLLFVGRHDELRRIPPKAVFEPKRTEEDNRTGYSKYANLYEEEIKAVCALARRVCAAQKKKQARKACLRILKVHTAQAVYCQLGDISSGKKDCVKSGE